MSKENLAESLGRRLPFITDDNNRKIIMTIVNYVDELNKEIEFLKKKIPPQDEE